KKYLKEKYKKPGNVFLGLLHRLDRPVSGIILFAKTSKGAARLSEQFRNHKVEKTYHAIIAGKPKEDRGVLTNNLIKDEKLKKARSATGKNLDNTKEAKLYYEVVKSNNNYSLLKIKLETGMFHQIRSQLALAGFLILGDVKYGYKSPLSDKSVALCATGLSFYAATEDKKINLSVLVPEEWDQYLR
ncbi:MAG: RNA pseudouridine synthase, partial [Candidatus Daviesbacteria bacterium]|nr:RNA pseudouridine synthase [Candidatus Daviesbacteria bacterium]